jgi:hypothetical protein
MRIKKTKQKEFKKIQEIKFLVKQENIKKIIIFRMSRILKSLRNGKTV